MVPVGFSQLTSLSFTSDRAFDEIPSQEVEIGELCMHRWSDSDLPLVSVAETMLKKAKQTFATRDGNHHAAQLAKHLVPFFEADTSSPLEAPQDVVKSLLPMRGQNQDLGDRVNQPTQHNFAGGPGSVTFLELLEGGDLLPVGTICRGIVGSEHLVNPMEKDTPVARSLGFVALLE